MASADGEARRSHRRLTATVKESMRELNNQLSLFSHHVALRVELKGIDLDCYDLIAAHGPLSPTALARRAGVHPATMTGVLDRLQRGGWIVRERDPGATDRRAVAVRALRERNAELYRLLSGMNAAMDEICADYTKEELQLLADFLHRTAKAGRAATEDLATTRRGDQRDRRT